MTKRKPNPVPVHERHLLTIPDVAALLSVSVGQVERLVATGQLPSVLIGRSRRVRNEDLRAFTTNTGPTAA